MYIHNLEGRMVDPASASRIRPSVSDSARIALAADLTQVRDSATTIGMVVGYQLRVTLNLTDNIPNEAQMSVGLAW